MTILGLCTFRYPIVLAAVEHHFICVNETSIILWYDPADVKWVSVNANGAQANSSSTGNLSVSADGRSIFFGFDASNLVDGDSNNQHDFFVANNPLCEASGGWRYCGADGTAEGDETRKAELHALIEEIVAYPDAMIEVKYRIRNRYRTALKAVEGG